MDSDEYECEFDQPTLFSLDVYCVCCGKITYHPFYVTRHTGKDTVQLPFFNEFHANEYYLEKLRGYDGA